MKAVRAWDRSWMPMDGTMDSMDSMGAIPQYAGRCTGWDGWVCVDIDEKQGDGVRTAGRRAVLVQQ